MNYKTMMMCALLAGTMQSAWAMEIARPRKMQEKIKEQQEALQSLTERMSLDSAHKDALVGYALSVKCLLGMKKENEADDIE
jgi:hypothetical protein